MQRPQTNYANAPRFTSGGGTGPALTRRPGPQGSSRPPTGNASFNRGLTNRTITIDREKVRYI